MNFCPVCKREYKETSGYQTGRCPVCGSALTLVPDHELDRVRGKDTEKKA